MRRRGSSSLQLPQAVMERKRRDQMKELYIKLASLLRLQSNDRMSLLTLLDQATISLQQWKERVERLMARKEELVNDEHRGASSSEHNLQMVQVSETDSNLEVNLIVKVNNKKVELFRVLSIIEECGAEIVSCNFSCMGHYYMRYTIHAQAFQTRLGFDSSLIEYRLKHIVT